MIIKDAIILDGTGGKPYLGSIMVRGGRIASIVLGNAYLSEDKIIDCQSRLAVSPGFIDTHSHSDFGIFYDSALKVKLLQGITTDICGNCGISASPLSNKNLELFKSYTESYGSEMILLDNKWEKIKTFSGFYDEVEKLELKINIGFFVGHGTIRLAVMGMDNRKPTAKEMEEMKKLLEEAMIAGAVGMSSGLIYPPGVFSDQDEIIELCRIVKKYNGVYATHMRNESLKLLDSVKETIKVAEKSGVKALISHHKAVGRYSFGLPVESLKLIDAARDRGVDIKLDQYPYTACSTLLMTAIPPRYLDGGTDRLIELLKDKRKRKEITEAILADDDSWDNMFKEAGFDKLVVISGDNTPDAIGRSIQEYADEHGIDGFDALYNLLAANNCAVICVEFAMSEGDVKAIMANKNTMVGSDSGIAFEDMRFHPRTTGSFPRVLGKYVREEKVISLEEAIRKMTSLPAEHLGIRNKGYIRDGYDSDLVIFDPDIVIDKSDYTNPELPPEGIKYVIVGGEIAAKDNELIAEKKIGRLIRKTKQH